MNLADPSGEIALTTAPVAAVAVGIVIDIAINVNFDYDASTGTASVSIPPPSMFENGFPLPFFVGLDLEARTGTIPGTDFPIGIPTSCDLTVAPSVAPAVLGPDAVPPQT